MSHNNTPRIVVVPEGARVVRIPRRIEPSALVPWTDREDPVIDLLPDDAVVLKAWVLRTPTGGDQRLPGLAARFENTVYATEDFPTAWLEQVR